MKRLIFTLSIIIAAGLITTAYSQVSIHASLNLGRARIAYNRAPVAYAPVYTSAPVVCAPAPAPYYNGYNDRASIVVGTPGRDVRDYRYEVRRDYRDHDYRDHRDSDHGHDRRR
ncbi:MAG TPA: hypothetical protein VGM41_14085 [Chitinophagaceae bacterium]